jgi:hypothetical protein
MKHISIICLGCLLILVSCSNNKTPKGILPLEKMQAVFWDYLRADVFATDFGARDTTLSSIEVNARMQKRLFSMHNISKETFDKSYQYYLDHRSLMKEMIDTMIVRHPREAAKPSPLLTKDLIDSVGEKKLQ